MAKVLVTDTYLTNVANAIREKNGETTTYKPSEMATAITNIATGVTPPTTGFVPTAWFKSGNHQQQGLVTDGIWYGTYVTQSAFATNPPDYIYQGPFGQLKNITFANEITLIHMAAFWRCKELVLNSLPESVKELRDQAFGHCKALALSSLPNSLTNIGSECFMDCPKITIKSIPSGITRIKNASFSECTSITELTCLGDITEIAQNAFYNCSGLSKFILPNITDIPTLAAYSFLGSGIAKGTGYIYVPDDLVDSFKSATNWSNYADQIRPISDLDNLIDLSNQTFPVTLNEGITVDYDASTTSIILNGTTTDSCGFNIPITQELIGNYTLSYSPAEANRGFYISIDNITETMLNGWGTTEKTFTLTEQPSQLMFWFDHSDSIPERNVYENYTIKLKLVKNEEGSSE